MGSIRRVCDSTGNKAWIIDIRIEGKRVRRRLRTDEVSARALLVDLENHKKQKEFDVIRKKLLAKAKKV